MMRRFLAVLAFTSLALPSLADPPSAEQLIEGGHWNRARAMVEPRLRANASDAQATYLLGRIKLAGGDLDGALELAEKAVQIEGKNADYHFLLSSVLGRQAQEAGVFTRMGLARRFKREAELAAQLDPKHTDARWALMEFHMKAPGIIGGDRKKAYALAEEIGRIRLARGYLAQAEIARREKRRGDQEELYRKAVEAEPQYYDALMTMANFYASNEQKKYDVAMKHARQAQKLEPSRVESYTLLAVLFALQERWNELDMILAEAEKNVSDNLNPYYQAGRVLLLAGKDLGRAERYFRKYLTQEPELNNPSHAHAWWRLGLVLEKQGRKPEAIKALQTSLQLKPDLEEATNDLKRLR